MKKSTILTLLPILLWGCGFENAEENPDQSIDEHMDENEEEIIDLEDRNETDISFDPNQPIVSAEEVDWIDIHLPEETMYTTDRSIMYRLTLEAEEEPVYKLADPIIQRQENEEWVDVTPEEGNPNFDYHQLENLPDVGMNIQLENFGANHEGEESSHVPGNYRAIEVFYHGEEGNTEEVVQVEIPFVIVEEDIPDEIEIPDFVEVDPEETTLTPQTEELTFSVTNNHEELEVSGGEYYILERFTGETWDDITPVEAFEDIGYSLIPGDSHEFSHILLAEDQDELEIGRYRIRKEFMLLDGTEDIPSDEADRFEIAIEIEVEEE